MTKLLIIVNGHPRAGKDTAVDYMSEALRDMGVSAWAMSSIDPVRDLLAPVSDLSSKTEADRKLLSVVGRAVEDHSSWRTRQVANFACDQFHHTGNEDTVVFVHMREPDLIEKTRLMMTELWPDARFLTIFVDRPSAAPVTSNASDAAVEDMLYDLRLFNDGDIYDFRRAATRLAAGLIVKEAA